LEGMEYVGPFDQLPAQSEVLHEVVLLEEVGREGAGIVHIAPGCGQEDFELGERYGLPAISPIDEHGVFLKGFEPLTGKSVFDTNEEIFDSLSRKGTLYKIHDYEHRYPECWRCHEEIVFRLVDEWFLAVPKVRQLLLDEVDKVEWKPAFGRKLMKDWLAAMEDWCISRKRYWGLPLPFYECKNGHLDVISSKKELFERAIDGNEAIPELHRPWIDRVKIRCRECREEMTRIPEVGDCWLDAGIVPFSTLNYLDDRDHWNEWFPSELVLEMREQVRLWFYSLLVMSCVLEGRAPFKSVVMYSRVVDEDGEAMHRSKGNVIWFDEAIERMGADVMRWVYCSQNPRVDLRFGYSSGKQAVRLLSILWNVYRFFMTYASVDRPSLDPTVVRKCDGVLDRWIVSRLNSTLTSVAESLNDYQVYEATKPLEDFILDLANWYVRRSRRRFWKTESDEQKTQGYSVLFHVLLSTSKMLASFTPFLSEEIYQGLIGMAGQSLSASVHLCDYPAHDRNFIEMKLEEEMAVVRKFVEMGLSLRSKMKLRVRQPLVRLRAMIDDAELMDYLRDLLLEELNVKEYDENLKCDCIEEEFGPPHLKIWLDTTISEELMDEAFVRDLVRRVQRMRKEKDLHVEDRIYLYVEDKDTYLAEILSQWKDYIMQETYSERILTQSRKNTVPLEIAGRTVFVAIERSPKS
ncbi:MAG: class I tRNA ligase family protein, partial [Methanobacteriota archaeon]